MLLLFLLEVPIQIEVQIEVPITNEKPNYYQVHDINLLLHNVAHTYHPENTEPIVPTHYAPKYTEIHCILHNFH